MMMENLNLSKLTVTILPVMEYGAAWELQKEAVHAIDAGTASEQLILCSIRPHIPSVRRIIRSICSSAGNSSGSRELHCLRLTAGEILHIMGPASWSGTRFEAGREWQG